MTTKFVMFLFHHSYRWLLSDVCIAKRVAELSIGLFHLNIKAMLYPSICNDASNMRPPHFWHASELQLPCLHLMIKLLMSGEAPNCVCSTCLPKKACSAQQNTHSRTSVLVSRHPLIVRHKSRSFSVVGGWSNMPKSTSAKSTITSHTHEQWHCIHQATMSWSSKLFYPAGQHAKV